MKRIRQLLNSIKDLYRKDIREQLEEADAIVLEFHPTGSTRKGMSEARLLLQVMPRTGRNYVTECQKYFTNGNLQELYSGAKAKIYFRHNEPLKIRWLKNVNGGD